MGILQIRLKNCIQTILDLEPAIHDGVHGCHFDVELTALKGFLREVNQMSLEEEDVQRMENATATLLADLRHCLGETAQKRRLLQ